MFDWATLAYNKTVDYTKEKYNDMLKSYEEAKKKLNELITVQKTVDAKIAKMPYGPARTKLMLQRDESRGFFSSYVMPAWEKISSYFGTKEKQMGAVPLIAIGGTLAITSALTAFTAYTVTSYKKEMAILNDPNLSASQKSELIATSSVSGGLSKAMGGANKLIMGIGAISLLYIGFKVAQKRNLI